MLTFSLNTLTLTAMCVCMQIHTHTHKDTDTHTHILPWFQGRRHLIKKKNLLMKILQIHNLVAEVKG